MELLQLQFVIPVFLLSLFWCWETWWPYFGQHEDRLRHAARNLGVAVMNTVVLGLTFGAVTVLAATWTEQNHVGILNFLGLDGWFRFVLAMVLLDGWMYVWHRANHMIPFLWRFHRMHHSDRHMDVTTAARFHLGEHVISSTLRLALIPLLGLEVWNLVVYDSVVIAVIMFHHADISIGGWDRWLRVLIVTPNMHKVHHSDWRPETDSNFSTVLSCWDRLARTFRMRSDPKTIVFGLEEFSHSSWQSWWSMWKIPFVSPTHAAATKPKRVVFVCNENCNRSQMAEAFARRYGAGRVEAFSVGLHPAQAVHAKALTTMEELGYDLHEHSPKGLAELSDIEYDVAVTMGCDVEHPDLKARRNEDWNIPVPKELPIEQFRAVRDEIGKKVQQLIDRL